MMGTIKTDPEPPDTRTQIVMRNVRLAVAGDERAAVRRIVLYVVVGMMFPVATVFPTAAAIVGLAGLLLLLATDQLL